MNSFDNTPPFQLAQTGADVGTGDGECVGDFFCVQWFWGQVEQCVNLSDSAVDAPLRAHFTPVEDKFLLDRAQGFHVSVISVCTEITDKHWFCQAARDWKVARAGRLKSLPYAGFVTE